MKPNANTPAAAEAMKPLEDLIRKVKAAQATYATYTQDQVDRIFRAAALAASCERIRLAKMAVEEDRKSVV